MNVAIIGCGYVGLTTATALAYAGHKVTGIDNDETKIFLLLNGKSPIHEKGLEQLIKESGRSLRFTTDSKEIIGKSEVIIIAVGTPAKTNGEADTSYVEAAAVDIAKYMEANQEYTIVVKSTVPIGTNYRVSSVVKRILAERGIKASYSIASNPEFLREGMALSDTLYPDRIVVGADDQQAIEKLRRLYRPILEQTFIAPSFLPRTDGFSLPPMVTTNPASAEMIKYASNAFLALKISYINEVAGLCEKVGADVTEVARGMGLDPRIGRRFLNAGIGWGGSCFPKDTSALQMLGAEYNYSMPIVDASIQVNNRQRQVVTEKIQSELRVIRGRTIGILGLAFKPDTDDVREAPAIDIIKQLVDKGAHVKVHDPIAISNAQKILTGTDVEFYSDPYRMAQGCDCIVLLTEWDEYRRIDFELLRGEMSFPLLIDGRNFLNPEELVKAEFIYRGVGK
jgi:UDPglucose 6-dehydrogenase